MKKMILGVGVVLMGLLLVASLVSAEIPHLMNFQGRLTDASGAPVPDGTPIKFSIYNVSGAALWNETHPSASDANGIFNVLLGSVDPINNPLDLPFDEDYWLGIKVGTDPEMTPRQRITSVGYAFKAGNADWAETIAANSVTTDKIVDGAIKAEDIGVGQVTSTQLANNAVDGAKIAAQAITDTHIEDTAQIDPNKIKGIALTDTTGSVSSDNIADGIVATADIADGAITAAKTNIVGIDSTTGKITAINATNFSSLDGSQLTNLPPDDDWTISGSNVYRTTGNVGIGTPDPGMWKLFVNGGDVKIANGNEGYLRIGSHGTMRYTSASKLLKILSANWGSSLQLVTRQDGTTYHYLTMDGYGNVGIGTTGPGDLHSYADDLVVGDGSGHRGITIFGGTDSRSSLHFADGTSGTAKFTTNLFDDHSADKFYIYRGNTLGMTIDNQGKVGIGMTNPGAKLEVAGQVKITGGSPGTGKVLTSDANGLASWQTPSGIPSGVIVMWSGTLASVPAGWHLCDGTTGTPDLRDRFIMGVPPGENPGATGGSTSHSHSYSALPRHSHTASISPNPHRHSYDVPAIDALPAYARGTQTHYAYEEDSVWTAYQSLDVTVDQEGSTSCSTASASSLPPYYKLAFIIKL